MGPMIILKYSHTGLWISTGLYAKISKHTEPWKMSDTGPLFILNGNFYGAAETRIRTEFGVIHYLRWTNQGGHS